MNNLQPLLYIGIPAILILAGMFFNWSAANGLRSEFQSLRTEVRGEIASLRSEVRGDIGSLRNEIGSLRSEVRGDIGSLRGEVGSLRGKLDDIKDSNHKDALEIMRQMTALHERVAIVESKQKEG